MNKTLGGCLRELKNKEKVQLGSPKSGCGSLLEPSAMRGFITRLKSHFVFSQRW